MATRQFWEKGLRDRLMVEMAAPSKVCFPLISFFFEVMLMSGMDGIRSFLEDYILLFLFDVYFHFLHSYVRVLSLWNFGFSDI